MRRRDIRSRWYRLRTHDWAFDAAVLLVALTSFAAGMLTLVVILHGRGVL